MNASRNPFDYRPGQIAKALVAVLTSTVTLLGILAGALSSGGLADAGLTVASIAAFLAPAIVFLKKAAPLIDMIDGPDTPDDAGV